MKILLWTWQGHDFSPLRDRLDRSKSDFWRMDVPGCPDIRQAYADLDERLCLPKDREHQFVFCSTTDPEMNWRERRLWRLDVPQDSVLAFLDEPRWLHLIGDRSLPDSFRDQLNSELRSQKITPEKGAVEAGILEKKTHTTSLLVLVKRAKRNS